MTNIGKREEEIASHLTGLRGNELVKVLAKKLAELEKSCETLNKKLELLSAYEQSRDILLAVNEPIIASDAKLSRYHEVLASEAFTLGEGFHQLEFNKDGQPYRWAAQDGHISYSCAVDRSFGTSFGVELYNTVAPENYTGLQVFDGSDLIKVTVDTYGSVAIIKGKLAAKRGQGHTVHLTLRFPVTRELSDADKRVAGVAFHKLWIKSESKKDAV